MLVISKAKNVFLVRQSEFIEIQTNQSEFLSKSEQINQNPNRIIQSIFHTITPRSAYEVNKHKVGDTT